MTEIHTEHSCLMHSKIIHPNSRVMKTILSAHVTFHEVYARAIIDIFYSQLL
jgi:hypothetical protein